MAPPNPLRTNSHFRLLWIGQTISVLGSRASAIAFPLLVLSLTGSPASAGVVGFAGTLPFLVFQLPAGGYVDRWDRKRTMIWCDLGRGVALASIAIAMWAERLTLAQIVLVAFVEGSLFVFFNLAENAAIPKIVSSEQLSTALAQNEASTIGSRLAGAPLGGLLFGIAQALPFVVDALSYVASIGTIAAIPVEFQTEPPAERDRLHLEVAQGFRWLWSQPFIRATSLLVAGTNFIIQALILVVVVVAKSRGAAPAEIGVILAFIGIGGLLGSLVAAWAQRHLPPRAIVMGVNWLWVALLPLMALPTPPIVLGPIIGVMAFVGPTWNVLVSTYELSLIPDRLLGRVESVILLLAWGSIPLGSLVAGSLLEWLGPTSAIYALSGVMALVALAATISPAVRHAPPLPTSQPGGEAAPVPA
jgi:MFS family permease